MKTIGIKLADGSFYPVLEEFSNSEKQLDLTTAHNNQTKVMVDLYRSKNCSMDDAEYVDSLQIENLVAHPNGEPNISFSVSIDENNKLSAKIKDAETGNQSKTTITLVSRTLEERLNPDDYKISDSNANANAQKDNPKTSKHGFFAMASKMRQTNKNDEDENSESQPQGNSTIIGFTPAANDEINRQIKNQNEEEIIPDDENEDIIIEENIIENDETPEINETSVPEPNDDDQMSDLNFDFPGDDSKEVLENAKKEKEFAENSDKTDFATDIPDDENFDDETFSQENVSSNEFDANDDDKNSLSAENFDEKPVSEENAFDTENSQDFDFATDVPDEEIFEDENISEPNIDIFPDADIPNDETLADFEKKADEITLNENKNDFPANDEFFSDTDIPNDDFSDFPAENIPDEETAVNSLDNLDDINISDKNFSDSSDNGIPDDFSLPDIDEIDDSQNQTSKDDDFFNFDDDSQNNSQNTNFANKTGSGALSFTGLYDKETEMGESAEDEKIRKKTKTPVIICIICAIICILATLLILFIVPSKYNLLNKNAEKNETEIAQQESQPAPIENKTFVEPEQTEPETENQSKAEIAPPAKEEEIVIVEEAEIIVPEQPPATPEKPDDIVYKIKWGDTLWDIADTYYKNPWRYKYIAHFNKIKDPDYIISGTYITIPAE